MWMPLPHAHPYPVGNAAEKDNSDIFQGRKACRPRETQCQREKVSSRKCDEQDQ